MSCSQQAIFENKYYMSVKAYRTLHIFLCAKCLASLRCVKKKRLSSNYLLRMCPTYLVMAGSAWRP